MRGDGDLWISPNGSSVYWDQPKIAIRNIPNDWKPYRLVFSSGDRVDLDVRFVAEGPMLVWIDDVVVRRVPDGEPILSRLANALAWITARLRPKPSPTVSS